MATRASCNLLFLAIFVCILGCAGGVTGQRDGGDPPRDGEWPPDGTPDTRDAECFPPCLVELFASCPRPMGSCVLDRGPLNDIRWSCFENGVKVRANGYRRGGGGITNLVNDDGTWCYVVGINSTTEVVYYSRTARIAVITFESVLSNKGTVVCLDSRQSYPIDLDSPACADSRYGIAGETATMCMPGRCDIPPPT